MNGGLNLNYSLEYLCFTPESQYLERKSARKKPRELLKTLIGFANADGGVLVIGVEDDGRITGFNHSKAHSIESFQQIDRELVSTPIMKRFDIIPVTNEAGESDNILIICVDPSVNRVIVAPNDVVYLRQGDETIELSYERRRMLEYDRGQRYVEDELVLDATLEDIDEDLITEFQQHLGTEVSLSTVEVLKARNLYRDEYITKAGILLFGKDPSRFLPQARLKFVRFGGTEMGLGQDFNVIKSIEFNKALPRVITESREFIKTQLRDFQTLQDDGIFTTVPEYPEFAWFEGIVNAVTHRDYSVHGDHIRVLMYDDHLSIESPGKLPNIVTIENIREERFSRNPRIARILSEFGWVREMNEGVKRIYSEMAQYYLHDPVYTDPGNKVVLTLENSILTRQTRQENLLGTIFPNYDELSLVEKRLVQYMYNTGEHLTTSKAMNIVNRSRSNVSKILGNLRALGIVEWFGSSPRDKRQYYKLNL